MKIVGVKMHDRTGGENDFVVFDLADVKSIDMWRPTAYSGQVPAYHTEDGSYLAINTLKDAKIAYRKFGFESFDNTVLINMNKVVEFLPIKTGTKVMFDDGTHAIVRKKIKERRSSRGV